MKRWPPSDEHGDLPVGVHRATLREVLAHFANTPRRIVIARRLADIHRLARSTGQVARFVVFGSFVTAELAPTTLTFFADGGFV
ncbi:MAG: hypothetical protein RMK20_01405 [Verrucomicrobiales bacterium]|nr:hypothetical protein [Verrucomicrobiales bacterium]